MAEAQKKKKQVMRKPSAIKRARQSVKRHTRNRSLVSFMRNQIKHFRTALTTKNKTEAKNLLTPTLSTIAQMVSKGILHKNTAARYTSRLQKKFNQI